MPLSLSVQRLIGQRIYNLEWGKMKKIVKKFLGYWILFTVVLIFLFFMESEISPTPVLAAVALAIPLSLLGTYPEIHYFRASFAPMQVRVKPRAGERPEEEIQTEFTSHNRFSLYLSIAGVVCFIIFAVAAAYLKPENRLSFWLSWITGMLLLIPDIISYFYSRLMVSAEGITCRLPLYQVQVKWDEIKQIEHRGRLGWFISCHTCEVKAFYIVAGWLKFFENDRIIPLNCFAPKFAKSKLLKSIHYYAPGMVFMTEE